MVIVFWALPLIVEVAGTYATFAESIATLFTQTSLIVAAVVPVLEALRTNLPVVEVPTVNVMLVILTSSVAMNPTVKAPIHAATAMLTATVTAMSMIDATTGLRAFLLFLKFFISLFIPPLGLMSMLEEHTNLNLAT
jgi:hypothetical protein